MNKARIVIASVLKPVTEPRALDKLALSMRETNKYHLNIIGFYSKKTPTIAGIRFTIIFSRHRTHLSRALVPFRFLWELLKYRPALVIVTTYELVPLAIVGKVLLRYQLVYDVQENYHKNVLLNKTMPSWLGRILAFAIKAIEKCAHPFLDHYFFAEKSYPPEFPYIREFTVLENKYPQSVKDEAIKGWDQGKARLIITGTITPVYGIERAIEWFLSLQSDFPDLSLKIVGHAPLKKYRMQLEELAEKHPRINLKISPYPIPYSVIHREILAADIVLMPYENTDSIRHKIPTKLYESIALQKPVLISANPLWQKIIAPYPAGLAINFSSESEAGQQYRNLLAAPLYLEIPGKEVTWQSEEPKLLKVVEWLLNQKKSFNKPNGRLSH